MDYKVYPNREMQIAILYDCIRYHMVYGIEVVKFGRRIGISSVWTRHTVVFNCRASVSLEFMSSPDGECISVSY